MKATKFPIQRDEHLRYQASLQPIIEKLWERTPPEVQAFSNQRLPRSQNKRGEVHRTKDQQAAGVTIDEAKAAKNPQILEETKVTEHGVVKTQVICNPDCQVTMDDDDQGPLQPQILTNQPTTELTTVINQPLMDPEIEKQLKRQLSPRLYSLATKALGYLDNESRLKVLTAPQLMKVVTDSIYAARLLSGESTSNVSVSLLAQVTELSKKPMRGNQDD